MMNPLRTYLDASGETAAAFARRLGVSPSYLSRILTGERQTDATLIAAICRATDYQIRPDQWIAWWEGRLGASNWPASVTETEGAA